MTKAIFGYRPVRIAGHRVLLAEPEKALLYLWYLEKGRWTMDRLREMRFENTELVDVTRFQDYAQRFTSKRLIEVADKWIQLSEIEDEGTVGLEEPSQAYYQQP